MVKVCVCECCTSTEGTLPNKQVAFRRELATAAVVTAAHCTTDEGLLVLKLKEEEGEESSVGKGGLSRRNRVGNVQPCSHQALKQCGNKQSPRSQSSQESVFPD